MRIGVDLLGSDSSPHLLLSAAEQAQGELADQAEIVVIGRAEVLDGTRLESVEVTEEVTTEEPPLTAVRRKKDSSISVGMRLLKEGRLDALVSTGNTGALVASAVLTLGMLPGIDRPGLLALLPTLRGSVAVIDIGANVSPKPHHYLQFARYGKAYQRALCGVTHPKVGLLNIGTEAAKGSHHVREAYRLLKEGEGESFVGNVEGRDAFRGEIEVLVTDGFSGNIFLKTAEGISMFILEYLREMLGAQSSQQVAEALDQLERRFHYAEYPGALVCGVGGVVVKCHGFSSQQAILNGILGTARLIEKQVLSKIKQAL